MISAGALALATATVPVQAVVYDTIIDGSDAIWLAGRTDLAIPAANLPWPGGLLRHGGPTPEEILETMPPGFAISGGDGEDKVSVVKYGRTSYLSMYPFFWDESWSKYLVFTPNEWRDVTIDFNSGNATSVSVSFGAYQRAGTYSFDDVSLVEIQK